MFKKIIPLLMLAVLWVAAPVSAENGPRSGDQAQRPEAQGLCYSGLNGRGQPIKWAKTKGQCRNQSNGKSWGHSGHYENFYREARQTWR